MSEVPLYSTLHPKTGEGGGRDRGGACRGGRFFVDGILLVRNYLLIGPYSRTMSRPIRWT